jgi:hypothetical protein
VILLLGSPILFFHLVSFASQALLSRGDRRLQPLLLLARGFGDSLGAFRRAFKELDGRLPPLESYVHHNMEPGAVLPWAHLRGPLPEATLAKHYAEAVTHMRPSAASGRGIQDTE